MAIEQRPLDKEILGAALADPGRTEGRNRRCTARRSCSNAWTTTSPGSNFPIDVLSKTYG